MISFLPVSNRRDAACDMGYTTMMDPEELLQTTVRWRKNTRPDRTVPLSEALSAFMESELLPRRRRFEPVNELWEQLLPAELNRHCRIDEVSGGLLKVIVDSPVYLHELRLCSAGLLTELQRNCRTTRIKKIKFVLGQILQEKQP